MATRPAGERREIGRSIRQRVGRLDFGALTGALDTRGHALVPRLLSAAECHQMRALWPDAARFRKRVDLARHRFGDRGAYRYLARPLPPLVAALRRELYPPLARVANAWAERLRDPRRFPPTLGGLARQCRAHGQRQPTPLVLDYESGGYNCLHQDLYGPVWFPLQVAIGLSRPGRDYEGGAFLLVESRARQQSRGEAVVLGLGDAVVFPTAERPVPGARGFSRAKLRHGVATVTRGHRMTLGIIFHDAKK